MTYSLLLEALKGGPGSGNWGHAGRTGKRGGSMPQSGFGAAMSLRSGANAQFRKAMAKPIKAKKQGKIFNLLQKLRNRKQK